MLRNVFVLFLSAFFYQLNAQFTLKGIVSDNQNQVLIGANVVINDSLKSAVTNSSGEYSISGLPKGVYQITFSFIGYKTQQQKITVDGNVTCNVKLEPDIIVGDEIIVRATRADKNTPTTYTMINKEDLNKWNLGQDIPFLLGFEPSLVVSSDAGAGVGYTDLKIRGSNIQRINVTVNGVPLNDAESHGVYWVNMPDFSTSVESAQVQRGVGTSTNGSGVFGATINFETNRAEEKPYAEINSSAGSFNTLKNNVKFGTGLIKNKWFFEGRASKITSDGYIDRAKSDLQSFFVQGGYQTGSTTIKAIMFTGKEKTYQSWNGIDKAQMDTNRTYNSCGAIYDENWNVTGFYDNETDNYQQDHYQIHVSQKISDKLSFNAALHCTYGRGYFEQYYSNEDLSGYPAGIQYFGYDSIPNGSGYDYFYRDTVEYADMIVRRWLDNYFYGATFAMHYSSDKISLIWGGGANNYSPAKHYGEVIWSQFTGSSNIRDKFYESESHKSDINTYIKAYYSPFENISLFADMQIRQVVYTAEGTDKGNQIIDIDENYLFFNPKFGISYKTGLNTLYASYAVSNREPVRSDFTDAEAGVIPKPERLGDMEIGIRKQLNTYSYSANVYYMHYNNQLVLTGKLNDQGYPLRANVGKSHRMGIEVDGNYKVNKLLGLRANIALSDNRTDFKRLEPLTDSTSAIVNYNNARLAYSPEIVSSFIIESNLFNGFNIALTGKYVGKQFLDNTGNDAKSLDSYFINDLQLSYNLPLKSIKQIRFSLMINNLFDIDYESNAYLWGETPYFFPQAGINFLGGITLMF